MNMMTPMADKHLAGRLFNAETARTFALAGNARLTIVSMKTGVRFTFKISAPKQNREGDHVRPEDASMWFVSLLTGPDNDSAYSYLGLLRNGTAGVRYEYGRKSKIGQDATSVEAFKWFAQRMNGLGPLPSTLEVWHEGSCGRCGRTLTVPESVASGFGPECVTKVGFEVVV